MIELNNFSNETDAKLKIRLPKFPSINILPNPTLNININRKN